MIGWVVFLGAAPLVAWVASRHGRDPIPWGLAALVASGVASAVTVAVASVAQERSEFVALVGTVLAPVVGLVASVVVGALASRPVVAPQEVAPAVESAPDRAIEMVHLANNPVASEAGSPYRAENRCRLVLGARMLTLEGTPPARTSLAYRLVDATGIDGDVLRLAWTNGRGEDAVVLLRPASADADERAAIVSDVVRHATARRQAG